MSSAVRSRCRLEVGVRHVSPVADVQSFGRATLNALGRELAGLSAPDALTVLADVRSWADSKEATVLASQMDSGATDRSVESLLTRSGKTSKRKAKSSVRRAKAVKQNPDIATKIDSGALSADQADVIAAAAAKTDGAAANDEDLIAEVAATPPDQARKIADEWVRKHTSAADVQASHDRQRRLRGVRRWATDRDTHILAMEGDEASINRVEQSIRNRSKAIYQADGGRDLGPNEHPRTRSQRDFDAAVELLTRSLDTSDAKGAAEQPAAEPTKKSRPSPRATVVVSMTADQAADLDDSPIREIGGGLLAPSVLDEFLCGAEFVALLVDDFGTPLKLGRRSREFSHAQWLALIIRDEGCTRCGAHYSECHAHHIISWNAPARGPTDIENGALLCSDCHHFVHEHDLILVRDPTTGTWSTRPARPEEIAPKRRPKRKKPNPDEPAPPGERASVEFCADERARESAGWREERRRPNLQERRRTGALF